MEEGVHRLSEKKEEDAKGSKCFCWTLSTISIRSLYNQKGVFNWDYLLYIFLLFGQGLDHHPQRFELAGHVLLHLFLGSGHIFMQNGPIFFAVLHFLLVEFEVTFDWAFDLLVDEFFAVVVLDCLGEFWDCFLGLAFDCLDLYLHLGTI